MLELCNNYIKYNTALALLKEPDGLDLAYNLFMELDNFLDSADYAVYTAAKKDASDKKYGEAAEKYLSISDFLDSYYLFEKNMYAYYDRQYQLGNKDLYALPFVPMTETKAEYYEGIWREKRLNSIRGSAKIIAGAADYYAKTDNSVSVIKITGTGIYIDGQTEAKYGLADFIDQVNCEIPVFFIADSLEKVRYLMNFTVSSKYYGIYDDDTLGFETTLTVIIKDTVTGEILFIKSYTAVPPRDVYFTASEKGDTYAVYDFFEPDETGESVFDKDIRPVLESLYQ